MTTNVRTAHAVWEGGQKFTVMAGSGHAVVMDATKEHGGEDSGPSPVEVLLQALAGCTGMDVISILRKQRQPVQGLEVHVRGERAETYPRKYTDIAVEYVIYGADVSPEAVERAIRLSEEQYCSVSATINGVAHIHSTYRIAPARDAVQGTEAQA